MESFDDRFKESWKDLLLEEDSNIGVCNLEEENREKSTDITNVKNPKIGIKNEKNDTPTLPPIYNLTWLE